MPELVSLLPSRPSAPVATSRRSAPRDSTSRVEEGGAANGAIAFAATLLRSQVTESIRAESLKLELPSQMFEAQASDPRAHRQAVLEQDYRAGGLNQDRSGDADSAGIEARRDRAASAADNSGSVSSKLSSVRNANLVTPRQPSADPLATKQDAARSAQTDSANVSRRPAVSATSGGDARRGAPRVDAPVADRATPITPPDVAGPATVATPSTTQRSGPPLGSVAHEAARALTVNRAGEVESARATTAVSDTTQTPKQRQASGRESSASRAESGASRPASDAEANRAVEQSPFDRMIRAVRMRTTADRSSAVLHLNPPRLGRVRVDVKLTGDRLAIDVQTETDEARRLLTERVAELRAALQEHGIRMDQIDVTLTPDVEHGASAASDQGSRETNGAFDGRRDRSARVGLHAEDGPVVDAFAEEDSGMGMKPAGERRIDVRV